MSIIEQLQEAVVEALSELYHQSFTSSDFQVNQTKDEFEGDYTVVLFSLLRKTGKNPAVLGEELGKALLENRPKLFAGYNIIKGFLNLSVSQDYFTNFLERHYANTNFGQQPASGKRVMVEYSSPNTNKPLHLGHLRNIFLGWSVAEILKTNGDEVFKSCIVNDRGIHICKSMLAWTRYANGATPETTNTKGDHLVGDYYVRFENDLREESQVLINKTRQADLSGFGDDEKHKVEKLLVELTKLDELKDKQKIEKIHGEIREIARSIAPVMQQAKQMLVDWEQGKPEVIALWKKMNGWVYDGFDATYKLIGADFDKTYYESDTYLLGKNIVQQGLDKGIFYQREDGSIWIDLTAEGLDEKIVQRRDGTSVYITQDIGLALQKYEQFKIDENIYVIGNEQNYHMQVLKLICEKLGIPNAENIQHLSYGMVELTTGKMKSREGTVVDADDIVAEMIDTARRHTIELGKVKDFSEPELEQLYKTLGLGAMKFYLLRVDPKKKMVFNPEESIDFHGFTGPFVQYTFARISSILRKETPSEEKMAQHELLPLEKDILVLLEQFEANIAQAAKELNPSVLAMYAFNLAKAFNSFYTVHSIASAETPAKKQFRLKLSLMVAHVLQKAMHLLGITVPERM